MRKLRSLDLEGFATYVERRPSRLGCWRDGKTAAYPTLAWLNVQPVVELRKLSAEIGPHAAVAMSTAAHHNKVGIGAGWVTQHMTGDAFRLPSPEQDREALWTLTERYWALRNLLVEVRVGLRGFESEGTIVRLPYQGNHEVDALDRMLDFVGNLESLRPPKCQRDPRLAEWIRTDGLTTPWDQMPSWVQDLYRSAAADVLETYPKYLPPTASVAGFTVAELDAYWCELMARGTQMNAEITAGSLHPPTIVPAVDREGFIEDFAASAGIDAGAVERITTLHTIDVSRCPDAALTPLVSLGRALIPMSSLIVPGAPHRNALAIVQSDPNLFGEAGRLLGMAGEHETLQTLDRMAKGTLVASRVKARRRNGDPAGDLDVVVCDPRDKLIAVFEIKWHIAADGNAEVYRMEGQAIEKRKQVERLRREVQGGDATVQWPAGWPDLTDFDWRWFVLTRDVLATRDIDTNQVVLRSHQLLSRTLRKGATLRQLIDLLESPPIPPVELCGTEWHRIRYGDLRVDAELLIT